MNALQRIGLLVLVLGLSLSLAACRNTAEDSLEPTLPSKPDQGQDRRQEALPTPLITRRSIFVPQAGAPTPTLHPAVTPRPTPAPAGTRQPGDTASAADDTTHTNRIQLADALANAPPQSCDTRAPYGDLFALVSLEYGLSRDFEPADLVPLSEHLPYSVTVGYPSEIREAALQPLVNMIEAMLDAGLQPQILSGYRSYAAQAIAWDKWNTLYPERAAIISAPPGHSEHQLGTVVDFGSPELAGLVGQPGIEFHTYFAKTSEGQWLAENAHRYGFTLSFTLEAFETTGFYYEPWHFRYVGKEMAERLRQEQITLSEFQLANEAPPCIP